MVTRDSAAKCSNRLVISSLAFLSLAKGFISSITRHYYGKYKEVQKPRETKVPSEMTETLNVRRRVI